MANILISYVGDQLLGYVIAKDDSDASPNYYGYVRADGGWYIMKETISPGDNTYEYARGVADFTTNWTNRAALSYSRYDNLF